MLSINNVRDPNVSKRRTADTRILNWFLYLPDCKQNVVTDDRKIDELMFLAHLSVNTSVISFQVLISYKLS
jgi:hypothetical protein